MKRILFFKVFVLIAICHPSLIAQNKDYFQQEVPSYTTENYIWETGLKISFANILDIYFPALMSDYLNKYSKNITDNYWQRIRFTLNLKTITRQIM